MESGRTLLAGSRVRRFAGSSVNRNRFNGHHGRTDQEYMRFALRLAARGLGWTSPNPAVGAVIVRAGRIVGQGYHRRAGLLHAEIEALRRAGAAARGATLYVTLEPCNHTGKTPPCCDAILAAGISRVVTAARDPNPVTDGRGIRRLQRSGVRVDVGVLAREAARLNAPFWRAMRTGLPQVIAKAGQSLDGKIATSAGESRWITSPAARRLAHAWRSRVDAVLVGVDTVLRDDPRLSARGFRHRPGHPLKVVVDSRLRTPLRARCLAGAPAWIATTVRRGRRLSALRQRGVRVMTIPARRGRVPLRRLCRELVRHGVHSVLIEGGSEVLASAFAERLVNQVVWFVAPLLIGGRTAAGSIGGAGIRRLSQAVRLTDVTYRRIGPDLCVEARVEYPKR
jgi:diaminohydroxyphosphoribosylaminopyrimidine deaminase/5-amino-6-(5-phosphoribosylamino)uracil reductase